jgi:phosphohistidine phosphatase SixA
VIGTARGAIDPHARDVSRSLPRLLLHAAASIAFSAMAFCALAAANTGAPPAAEAAAWQALTRGGAVMLLRHAQTDPGIGDPPGYRLDDCATQRNLSGAGRAQAKRLGVAMRARGVEVREVLASRWCRATETAQLAFARAEHWPGIDSFFDQREREAAQTAALRERVAAWRGPGTLVMVTHQVNITALTGVFPAMGEGVVVRATAGEAPVLVGRIAAP